MVEPSNAAGVGDAVPIPAEERATRDVAAGVGLAGHRDHRGPVRCITIAVQPPPYRKSDEIEPKNESLVCQV